MNSIISDYIKRPLLILFLAVILADLIYITFTKESGLTTENVITVTGKIKDKTYDKTGNVKTVTVGNVLCYVNQVSDLHIGSTVKITGMSHNFSINYNLGGFNARAYYKARKTDYYINSQSVIVISEKKTVKDRFMSFSRSISESVSKYCTFESGTINTLLLGNKKELSEDRKQIYKMAGVSHFLVISGLHISAIGAFIYTLFVKIFKKRTPACIISIIFLIAYGMMVGFGVSVIRALIMFSVRLFSYVVKCTYDQLSAASLAGAITLLIYPYMLTDSSFVYSYTTVFIISFYMIYHKADKRKNIKAKAANLLSLPIILSVFIMPVTLYYSGSYSFLAIIYNILLIPLSAPILVLAGLSLFSSAMNLPFFAHIFDFVLHLILSLLDSAFSFSAFFNACSLNGKPPVFMIFLYYILMVLLLAFSSKILPRSHLHRAPVFLAVIALCFGMSARFEQITMLYVGQGECVILKTGPDSAIISDCGSASDSNLIKYTVMPYLKAAGIVNIDAIFLSHPDEDHSNGIAELILSAPEYGISINRVYVPEYYSSSETVQNIIHSAKESKVPVYGISKGYREKINNLSMECISHEKSTISNDTNNDSLVFLAKYSSFSIILTGDISSEMEGKLLSENIKADILKVAHHGSRYSSGTDFIKKIRPSIAIVSAGINNWYGHPHSETLSRLLSEKASVYITSCSGEIDIYNSLNRMRVRTYVN